MPAAEVLGEAVGLLPDARHAGRRHLLVTLPEVPVLLRLKHLRNVALGAGDGEKNLSVLRDDGLALLDNRGIADD